MYDSSSMAEMIDESPFPVIAPSKVVSKLVVDPLF